MSTLELRSGRFFGAMRLGEADDARQCGSVGGDGEEVTRETGYVTHGDVGAGVGSVKLVCTVLAGENHGS